MTLDTKGLIISGGGFSVKCHNFRFLVKIHLFPCMIENLLIIIAVQPFSAILSIISLVLIAKFGGGGAVKGQTTSL